MTINTGAFDIAFSWSEVGYIGPKIMSSAKIAKFLLTSKNKAQNAEDCELDFSGESYESTDFMDDKDKLSANIATTESFLKRIGTVERSEKRVKSNQRCDTSDFQGIR